MSHVLLLSVVSLVLTAFGQENDIGNTNSGNINENDVSASRNCAHNLRVCHTMTTLFILATVILALTNIVTLSIWHRESIKYYVRQLAGRITGNAQHEPIHNDFD